MLKFGANIASIDGQLHKECDDRGNTLLHKGLIMEYEFFDTILKLLQNCHYNVNTKNKHGDTILHLVAKQDLLEYLKPILECGGDINAVNNNGETPLDIAINNGSIALIVELAARSTTLDTSKIINHRDADGNSLLHRAVMLNSSDGVKALIRFGIDPNVVCTQLDDYSDSGTPLHVGMHSFY